MATTGEIKVSPVQDEAGLEEFLRFPWRLYQQDPYWVPPLLPEQRRFLDQRRGPFFEFGDRPIFPGPSGWRAGGAHLGPPQPAA